MAGPYDIIRGLQTGLEDQGALPEVNTWAVQEFDLAGEDNRVQVPAVQMHIVSNVDNSNSNSQVRRGILREEVEDPPYEGNRDDTLGYLIDAEFRMRLQIDIWDTASAEYPDGRNRRVAEMGQRLQRELMRYDQTIGNQFIPEPPGYNSGDDLIESDGVLNTINDLTLIQGMQNDRIAADPFDRSTSPTLRRWTQELRIEYFDRINTVERFGEFNTIRKVHYPADGDFSPGVGEGPEIVYVPPVE